MFKKTLPRYHEYNGDTYLELHRNRTMQYLNNPNIPEQFAEEFYWDIVQFAQREFERNYGVTVYILGRGPRHVCIEDTPENSKNYRWLRKKALQWEQGVIRDYNSWKPEESE